MKSPNWEARKALRLLSGRPEHRIQYTHWDEGARRITEPSVVEQPILDLYVARLNRNFCAESADRYAAIRARVMAPVRLPRGATISRIHPVFDRLFHQLGLAA